MKSYMSGEIDSKILDKLDEWEKDSLPVPIELYIRLMRIQTEAKLQITVQKSQLPPDIIAERTSLHAPLRTFNLRQAESEVLLPLGWVATLD
jgi:hypothetical protein